MTTTYHHGDLRRVLLAEAERQITDCGVGALSLRGLARDAGVSHAAPAHHFGSKQGLLTAFAAQGHDLLAEAMVTAQTFLEMGVSYVRFAVERPAHFTVMFTPSLLDLEDADLVTARAATFDLLSRGADSTGSEPEAAGVAAWSLVHGLATLHLSGNLAAAGVAGADDVVALTASAAALLFAGGPDA